MLGFKTSDNARRVIIGIELAHDFDNVKGTHQTGL